MIGKAMKFYKEYFRNIKISITDMYITNNCNISFEKKVYKEWFDIK